MRLASLTPIAAVAIAWITIARVAFAFAARPLLLRSLFQETRPVELDVGIVPLEQPHRLLVDRRAADADAGRGAEPVQNPLPLAAAAPRPTAVGDGRRFITTLVACEAELRQGYFLFFFPFAVLAATALARGFRLPALPPAPFFGAAFALARAGSGGAVFCASFTTSVKRV